MGIIAKKTTKTLQKKDPVKSILISQPEPTNAKSPYFNIAKKYKLKIDFRQFIEIQEVSYKDFRKQKITLLDFSAVILTSRNAIDHFFRLCDELRARMPDSTKYFCTSEAVALYLQKYTQYRKRKVFYGTGTMESLQKMLLKYKKDEKVLYPGAGKRNPELSDFLTENGFDFKEGVIYNVVSSDLTDLDSKTYDMILLFSPTGLDSLYDNFPDFEQNKTRIAAFGSKTATAVEERGLKLNLKAPSAGVTSMSKALELYVEESNKRKR